MLVNKVSIDKVLVAPVRFFRIGDVVEEYNATWTANLNGVNSYITINDITLIGPWEFECDIYNISPPNASNFDTNLLKGETSRFRFRHDRIQLINNDSDIYNINFAFRDIYLKVFRLKLVVLDNPNKMELFINDIKVGENIRTGIHNFNQIGDFGFKGQLSNIKLIDKTNPDNSYFYPGTIRSYVDPDSANVSMPDSMVLEEVWSGNNGILTNLGSTQPFVPHLKEGEEYVGNYNDSGYTRGIIKASGYIYLTSQSEIGQSGSFTASTLIPKGATLEASNGATLKNIKFDKNLWCQCEVISGTDEEIQKGFQYPNTFKITQP